VKTNQWRTASAILVILLLGYGGVLQLRPLRAGGPLILESPGVAFKWGGSPPAASITLDTGALGILDATTALSNLLAAAAAWEDILSSSITLPNTGGVVEAGGVAEERTPPAGGVVGAGGVAEERICPAGGVVEAGGVAVERTVPAGGVLDGERSERSERSASTCRDYLQRVSAKGEVTREDLGHSLDTGHPNGELQCQVAPIGCVGHWDPYGGQDVYIQLDVEGRFRSQSPESPRCSGQLLSHATC